MNLNANAQPLTGDASCPTCRRLLGRQVRLVNEKSLGMYLSLPDDKLDWLINTHKLPKIRIRGEVMLDLRDVDQVVDVYKKMALRRVYAL